MITISDILYYAETFQADRINALKNGYKFTGTVYLLHESELNELKELIKTLENKQTQS